MFYKKGKYGVVLMLVLAMVLQIAGPIVSEYVYAGEDQEESEEFVEVESEVEEEKIEEAPTDEEVVDKQEDEATETEEIEEVEDGVKVLDDEESKLLDTIAEEVEDIKPLANIGTDLGNIFKFQSFKVGTPLVDTDTSKPIVISDGTKMELVYTWDTSGENIVDGSTARIKIPDAFKRAGEDQNFTNLPLELSDGRVVGKFSIIKDEIVFTFDQRMADAGNISNGIVGFGIEFNKEKFKTDIVQEVEFKDSSEKTMTVVLEPKDMVSGLNKKVKTVPKDARGINWTLDIINPGPDEMTDAMIKDALPKGLTIVQEDIKIFDLTVGFDGEANKGSETNGKTASVLDDRNFYIDLGIIAPYKGYRVEYTTKIVDITEKDRTFTNKAELSYSDGKTLEAEDTTNVIKRSDFIEKEGKVVGEDEIEWTLDINKGGGTVSNAVVKDTLPDGLILSDKATLYEVVDGVNKEVGTYTDLGEMVLGDLRTGHYRIIFKTDVHYNEVNSGDY